MFCMLCWYGYLKMNGEEFGDFQCDFEDFKKFFKSRNDLRCVYLVKGNKRFIWSRNNRDLNNDGRIRGFGGWMYVGKVK